MTAMSVWVFTVTLILDSPMGLPSDKSFSVENNQFRDSNKKHVEVSALAVHRDYRKSSHHSQLSLFMMVYIFKLCSEFLNVDRLIAVVHPHAYPFYSAMFNFKQSGRPVRYNFANNALGIHLSMDLGESNQYIFENFARRPSQNNLYEMIFEKEYGFFNFPNDGRRFRTYPKMDRYNLKYFFEEKTRLFFELSVQDFLFIKKTYELFFDLTCLNSIKLFLESTSSRRLSPVLLPEIQQN